MTTSMGGVGIGLPGKLRVLGLLVVSSVVGVAWVVGKDSSNCRVGRGNSRGWRGY